MHIAKLKKHTHGMGQKEDANLQAIFSLDRSTFSVEAILKYLQLGDNPMSGRVYRSASSPRLL